MRLEMSNARTRVVDATDAERAWLTRFLSFDDEARAFRRNRKTGRAERVKPPKIRLLDIIDDTFPSGLLPIVRRGAVREGFSVDVDDARAPRAPLVRGADVAWLRPYQLEALRAALRHERGILRMPTGSGKTELVVALARVLPTPGMFIVHRAGLMEQTAERYARRNAEHGVELPPVGQFGEGAATVGERLTVGTFQTVRARLGTAEGRELVRTATWLVVDECHTLPADTFFETALAFVNARLRFGVSGTPLDRGDRRSLMAVGALGPLIHSVPTEELVAAGVLTRPTVRFVEVRQDIYRPTFQGVYGEAVVRSSPRNKAIVEIARRAARPFIVFVKEIKHGKNLEIVLGRAGLNVKLVWGATKTQAQTAAIRDLSRGDLDGVIASVVWQEGIDVPELRAVVVACGGKSVIASLQRAGRGMRPTEGKTEFELWDISDVGNGMLERHSRARRRAYEREGFSVRDEALV